MSNYKTNYNLSKDDTLLIKGIAICFMLCHHLFYENPEYGKVIFQTAHLGKVCVALFIFLSFYGLTIQYQKIQNNAFIDTIKFVAKRLVKFYINYWVIFLIFVPLGVFVFGRELGEAYGEGCGLKMFFTDFLGINGFKSYNITWWFNQLIIYLYLLFPLLFFIIKKWKLVSLFIGVVVWFVNFPILMWEAHAWLLHAMLGIAVAQNIDKISITLNKINKWLLSGIVIVLFFALFFVRNSAIIPYFTGIRVDAFLAIVITLLAIIFIRNVKYISYLFTFLGKHSINIFMIHTFIFAYWFRGFIYSFENPFIIFFVLLIVCTIISVLLEFIKNVVKLSVLTQKIIFRIDKITL